MTCWGYRKAAGAGLVLFVALASASCGDVVRQGRSPAYLVIDNLMGASGAEPDDFDHTLDSDVVTNIKVTEGENTYFAETFYEDRGELEAHIVLKDPGTPGSPTQPSEANQITINRYHVRFVRADGRNTPGVDVPYEFDGAATATFGPSGARLSFVLVRAQAKREAPLLALRRMGGAQLISTIAEVTFYGQDQAGNAVKATGQIGVNFADWADPE
ncbi:MAG TPA: hypothetical protein PKK95_07440 [Vicinamibacterales bacterium]|nr:hypothetical protein [Vicinamibacterales bacterium]